MAAPEQSEDGRIAICVVETIYLLLLGVLGWLVVTERIHPTTEIGTLPTAVLWFGALGAVLLSLSGIFEHMHDWDNRYIPWHLARPLVGAAVAVIAVLILQAGILAVGSEPNASGSTTPKNLLYFLVAFLVGYREDTFRDLVKRLTDVILAPGGGAVAVAPVISGVTPGAGLAARRRVGDDHRDRTAWRDRCPFRVSARPFHGRIGHPSLGEDTPRTGGK
jgi:uncharacterized membrane protein